MSMMDWSGILVISLVAVGLCSIISAKEREYVLTLDHSNCSQTISRYEFFVVEFYVPWCGHCQRFAPEYEKAASILSKNEPPIVLAKVDLNNEANKGLGMKYKVQGFPTIIIFRNEGKNAQKYDGPKKAVDIVSYVKKQLGTEFAEIKLPEVASTVINRKNIFVGSCIILLLYVTFTRLRLMRKKSVL